MMDEEAFLTTLKEPFIFHIKSNWKNDTHFLQGADSWQNPV